MVVYECGCDSNGVGVVVEMCVCHTGSKCDCVVMVRSIVVGVVILMG